MSKSTKKEETDLIESREECFIITPIGALGSEVFNKAMGLIDAVIDPVLAELGMKAMPANRMQDLGSINKQLIKRVIEDRLVIANLTGLNPNVMYELAVRHGARKPVIIMAENGTRLPFDITDQRTIFYSDTLAGVDFAKAELRKKIEFALKDQKPDNPIYAYLENAKLFQEIGETDPNKMLLAKLNSIEDKLSSSNDNSVRTDEINFFNKLLKSNNEYRIRGRIKGLDENSMEFNEIMSEMYTSISQVTNIRDGILHLPGGRFEFFIPRISSGQLNALSSELRQMFPNMDEFIIS